ncbi:MAG: lysozyme inhibitor LprI family protein [Paracoccaceae bacterium]
MNSAPISRNKQSDTAFTFNNTDLLDGTFPRLGHRWATGFIFAKFLCAFVFITVLQTNPTLAQETMQEWGIKNDCDVSAAGTWSQADVLCASEHAGRASKRMDDAFDAAEARLKKHSNILVVARLRQSQDKWSNYVDVACEADALIYWRGTLMEWRRAKCRETMANHRTEYLNNLLP